MLLKFDSSKIRFQPVKIKQVTTALGGSISILDEEHYQKTGKERFHKIKIPISLARMFKIKYKVSQFMIPHEGMIMWYDDSVVTIEKAIENRRIINNHQGIQWTSNIERHFKQILPSLSSGDWYFDGLYVYQFENGIHQELKQGIILDKNGMFRGVKVKAYHLTYLNFKSPQLESRNCIAFIVDENTFSISAPIWKYVNKNFFVNDKKHNEDNENLSLITSFETIDDVLSINLNFALRAAKELADHFGYSSIQPLQLPQMMVKLNTVNLLRLPNEIKATTEINMKFTHALAWLLGLQHKAKNPQQFFIIRQLIKYLMTTGFFWKTSTNKDNLIISKTEKLPLFNIETRGVVNNHVMI